MIQLNVPDMSCGHCVASITRAVQEVDAGAKVEVDLGLKRVSIASTLPPAIFVAAIAAAGYTPAPR
jgi:copper chaperone